MVAVSAPVVRAMELEQVDNRYGSMSPLLVTTLRPSNVGDAYIVVMNNQAKLSLSMKKLEVYLLTEDADERYFGWSMGAQYKIQLISPQDYAGPALRPGEQRKFKVPLGAFPIENRKWTTRLYYGVKYANGANTASQIGMIPFNGCLVQAGWREGLVCDLTPYDGGFKKYVWNGELEKQDVEEPVEDEDILDDDSPSSDEIGEGGGLGAGGDMGAGDGGVDGGGLEADNTENGGSDGTVDEGGARSAGEEGVPKVPDTGMVGDDDSAARATWSGVLAITFVVLAGGWAAWFFLIYSRRKTVSDDDLVYNHKHDRNEWDWCGN